MSRSRSCGCFSEVEIKLRSMDAATPLSVLALAARAILSFLAFPGKRQPVEGRNGSTLVRWVAWMVRFQATHPMPQVPENCSSEE